MAQTTLQERTTTAVALVEKMGDKLLIPEKMSEDEAIQTILRFKKMREEVVNISRKFDAFPWDGAVALSTILAEKYGWVNQVGSWFTPAQLVTVQVGYNESIQVPWGEFALPGIDGTVETGVADKNGRTVFSITASVKRKWENEIKDLFDRVEAYLREHSIYRGKAIEIDFDQTNDYGFIEPKFMNVDVKEQLILPAMQQALVETEVFTPIVRNQELARHGASFRGCVVLAGDAGTGKTLTMAHAAKLCTKHNVFHLKVKRASQLAQGIEFARVYQEPNGAMVECEDFDRVASGERTVELDDLLNIVDGVDSKTSKVFIILTTNAVEKVNRFVLRNQRVRSIIFFTPPDAEAAEKLLRQYGEGILEEGIDLTEVGKALDGAMPALIADVIASSKLAALKMAPVGVKKLTVGAKALLEAIYAKKGQNDLAYRTETVKELPTIDAAIKGLFASTVGDMSMEGDKLVLKKEVYKFQTGANTIKLLD